jgi:hypothetical protein
MRKPFRTQNAAVTAAFFIAPLLPSIFIPLMGQWRFPPDVVGALLVYVIALPFVFILGLPLFCGGWRSHGARILDGGHVGTGAGSVDGKKMGRAFPTATGIIGSDRPKRIIGVFTLSQEVTTDGVRKAS